MINNWCDICEKNVEGELIFHEFNGYSLYICKKHLIKYNKLC